MRGNKNRLIPVALRVNQILVKLPCTLAYLPDRLASRSSRKGKRLLIKLPDRAADRGILWIPDANSVPLSPVDLPDSGVPKNRDLSVSNQNPSGLQGSGKGTGYCQVKRNVLQCPGRDPGELLAIFIQRSIVLPLHPSLLVPVGLSMSYYI